MPTVLVVDDDLPILELITRILREGGYDVIRASDGRAAWGIFVRVGVTIDLVLVDVVIPHMTGTELVERIAARRPELPLILMSGFAPEDLDRRGLVRSHGHLLTKPFTQDELLNLVRRLLPA